MYDMRLRQHFWHCTLDICAKGTRTDFYFLVKINEILLRKQTVTYVFDLFYLPLGFVFSSHVLNGIWRSLRRAICHVRDAADRMETPLLPKWTNKYLTVLWNVNMFHLPHSCYGWKYIWKTVFYSWRRRREVALRSGSVSCDARRAMIRCPCLLLHMNPSYKLIQNKTARRRVGSSLWSINVNSGWKDFENSKLLVFFISNIMPCKYMLIC